jgi:hypothetical protein
MKNILNFFYANPYIFFTMNSTNIVESVLYSPVPLQLHRWNTFKAGARLIFIWDEMSSWTC